MDNGKNDGMKWFLGLAVLVLLIIGGYALMTTPDDRTTGEHISDAIDSLDEGVDDAARELEDRTPAQRLSDEVEDATDGNAQ